MDYGLCASYLWLLITVNRAKLPVIADDVDKDDDDSYEAYLDDVCMEQEPVDLSHIRKKLANVGALLDAQRVRREPGK